MYWLALISAVNGDEEQEATQSTGGTSVEDGSRADAAEEQGETNKQEPIENASAELTEWLQRFLSKFLPVNANPYFNSILEDPSFSSSIGF